MAKIIIYSKTTCPYCVNAKSLLDSKGVSYEEITVDGNDKLREEMINKSNGRMTVPQIFINGTHVGGCDDLYKLDKEGKLNPLLKIT